MNHTWTITQHNAFFQIQRDDGIEVTAARANELQQALYPHGIHGDLFEEVEAAAGGDDAADGEVTVCPEAEGEDQGEGDPAALAAVAAAGAGGFFGRLWRNRCGVGGGRFGACRLSSRPAPSGARG